MNVLDTPYFCRSDLHGATGLHATVEAALLEAEERKMAPFLIMRLVAHPIGGRVTNFKSELTDKLRQQNDPDRKGG